MTFADHFSEKSAQYAAARPGYPAYRNIMAALGLEVVEIEANADAGFTLTPDSLERAAARGGKPLKGVLLATRRER